MKGDWRGRGTRIVQEGNRSRRGNAMTCCSCGWIAAFMVVDGREREEGAKGRGEERMPRWWNSCEGSGCSLLGQG